MSQTSKTQLKSVDADFGSRTAIVTGGGSGIGRAVSADLAALGARVYVLDKNSPAADASVNAIRQTGGRASAIGADVCDEQAMREAASVVEGDNQRIDILVNVAGFNSFAPPEETSSAQWQSIIDVNLTGSWNAASAVMPAMIRSRYGRIVNIGSAAGILGIPMAAPYTAAKHGIVGLTRALAVDLAIHGITVNCVAPGPVDTPLSREQAGPSFLQKSIERIPLGRLGTPQDIALAVRFFASADAEWITGTTLPVDGGLVSVIRAHHWD